MKIQILSIGNEVLCGDIVNTNAAWLSQELWKKGFEVVQHLTIADDEVQITEALQNAVSKVDVVISTGGLGPTVDDFTVEVAAKAFGLGLEKKPEVMVELNKFYTARGRTMTPNQEKQAMIPVGAEALINPVGSAPGVRVQHQQVTYFFLPGVPKEMKEIFSQSILPWLQSHRKKPCFFASKTLRCFGAEEAKLDHLIQPLLKGRVGLGNTKIAYRVSIPEVLIKLSSWAESQSAAKEELEKSVESVRRVVGDFIYGENEESLEEVVGKLLKEKNKTLALAESCTGGLIANRITNVPGASQYFLGGVVAYSNAVKMSELGVSEETLQKFGAVSAETALEMAQGVRNKFKSDWALAVTGIAGPDGGTAEKPVGTVHIALVNAGEKKEKKFHFPTNREWFKQIVAGIALNWIRKSLLRQN